MKTKIHKILGVALALVLVFGLVGAFIPVNQAEAQAYTPNQWNTMTIPSPVGAVLQACDVADFAVGSDGATIYAITGLGELGYWNTDVGITSAWATTPTPQSGTSSAKLIRSASGTGSVYVEFVPVGGITVADLDDIAATPEWSFYHHTPDTPSPSNWAQLELKFTDPTVGSLGYAEVTLMPLQAYTGTNDWVKQDVTATTAGAIAYYGVDEGGTPFGTEHGFGVKTLSDVEVLIDGLTVVASGDWILTRVRLELWDAIARSCYIDDVTIAGITYDLEQGAILRSTNGGQTFTALVSPTGDTPPLKMVTVSPDDPLAVAVVDSADVVFYSSNGGAVWTNLGANWATGEVVYDIAISIVRSTAILGRDLAVVTSHPAAATFGDIYTVGTTTTWADVGTDAGLTATYDFTSVTFEPNWVGGRSIVAVGHNAATSHLVVIRTSTPVTLVLDTTMSVTAVTLPAAVGVGGGVISSSLALPNDFDSTTAPAIQAYIGFTSTAGYDDVYRVDYSQTRKLGIAANIGIHSISFLGSRAGGNLFAGESAATQVHYSADPQTAMPTWSYSFKPPTGQFNTVIAMAPDFGSSATVYAGTSGVESGFSRTANGGVSYNQLSLIDTGIDALDDVMPAPDNSVVFLSTSSGANSSLWKSSTPPSAGSWERVRLRTTVGYIIRLSPDYLDDTTLYWCDVDATDIQKSNTGGDIFANRTAPANIADLTVESQEVVYMGIGVSIYASTNGAWFFGLPIIAQVQGVHSLAMAPTYPDKPIAGNVLCGGTGGGVSLSTDGASFMPLSASSATGNMQVLADKNYATNNLVYAGSSTATQGIYRYEVGVSTAWEQIRALAADETVTGLAMHCGALYGAWVDTSTSPSGADRSLWPFLPDIAALTFDRMDVGATAATFNRAPSSLRIAGGETEVWLWAINNASPDTLMGYNDTMAKAGPVVSVPSDVRFDPNTGGNAAFTITWNKISNALAYRVEIYTDAAKTQRVASAPYNFDIGDPTGTGYDAYAAPDALSPTWSVPTNTVPSGATYYVRVCIRDQVPFDAIRSPWGDVESFTVETGVPVMAPGVGPTLLGPIPGDMDVPLRPGFSWGPMAGTTEYEFVLATDAALSNTIAGTPVKVTTPSWQCPEDLAYNTTYFWGIKSSKPTTSAQSIGTFTTIGKPAAPPAPPAAPPTPAAPVVTPAIIWAIIAIGAILVIAVIVLILRTRRIA